MRRGIRIGAAVAAGAAVGTAVIAAGASMLWGHATTRATRRLAAQTPSTPSPDQQPETFSPEQLEGLPAPVVRYFTFALAPGQPLIRSARIRWEGEFRTSPTANWTPFTAVQHSTVRPPGFVWDANIRMAPLVPVRVRDEYVAGAGAMLGKVAALVPVANQRGTPEMAAGALSRYLGEAVWLPTALLPSAGVSWTPVDDSTARATLTDGATTVSADFRFAGEGQIVGVTMTRYRDVHGRGVPTRFEGRMEGEYSRVSGMMIPSAGEVAWLLPEGRFAYWRGRPVEVEYGTTR
jgi:hypothetical protein